MNILLLALLLYFSYGLGFSSAMYLVVRGQGGRIQVPAWLYGLGVVAWWLVIFYLVRQFRKEAIRESVSI